MFCSIIVRDSDQKAKHALPVAQLAGKLSRFSPSLSHVYATIFFIANSLSRALFRTRHQPRLLWLAFRARIVSLLSTFPTRPAAFVTFCDFYALSGPFRPVSPDSRAVFLFPSTQALISTLVLVGVACRNCVGVWKCDL